MRIHILPYSTLHTHTYRPYSTISILYHTCVEHPLVAIPRSSFSLCSQNSRFSFCLPFIYSSICGLIPDNPLKARPLNEIRDLWNRGRGRLRRRNLTFFFRVFSENRHLKNLHFTFFLISKVNRVIFIEEV